MIISGSIIEEILRIYIDKLGEKPSRKTFNSYIDKCKELDLFKRGISELSNFVREFRNYVHLAKIDSIRGITKKSVAMGAVSAIFTIIEEIE